MESSREVHWASAQPTARPSGVISRRRLRGVIPPTKKRGRGWPNGRGGLVLGFVLNTQSPEISVLLMYKINNRRKSRFIANSEIAVLSYFRYESFCFVAPDSRSLKDKGASRIHALILFLMFLLYDKRPILLLQSAQMCELDPYTYHL